MQFRSFLQRELDRRRAMNPRYTLRAFAGALSVDHSSLSQILRGKRRLTGRTVRTLGRRLRIDDALLGQYCAIENDAAVLGAVAAPGFRTSSRWLAMKLGISVDEVNVAIQRLLRTGRLQMISREVWQAREVFECPIP